MSCDLSVGLASIGCKDNTGGITKIYLANAESVASITAASGTISAITMATDKLFYEFALPKFSGSFTENIKASAENGTVYYEQVITGSMRKMSVANRNLIKTLATANLVAIVADANGNHWYVGETRNLDLTEGSAATGTQMGDKNGYSFTLTGMEPAPAQLVTSSIIAALLV